MMTPGQIEYVREWAKSGNEPRWLVDGAVPREGRVTRREKKRRTRERRSVRWNLVHAAGCVVSGCASRDPWLIAQYVAEARALGVSVPRSFRGVGGNRQGRCFFPIDPG